MASSALWSVVVVLTTLHHATGQTDQFDRIVPQMLARLEEVRKVLLPMPDDTLAEIMYNAGTYVIPLDAKTEICRNHSSLLFDSFLKNEMWALRMVDSGSKMPVGVLDGHLMDLGSYDQCLSVRAPGGEFLGQHCVVETKGLLPELDAFNPERTFLPTLRTDIAFAVCVPSSCSAEDVKVHMDVALNSVNATAIMTPYSCSNNLPVPYNVLDYIAMLVLLVIFLLLILSTWYDNSSIESEKRPLLTAWSLSHNIPRMLDTHSPPPAITCLNGLRVLALAWIITGHRMLYLLSFPTIRYRTIAEKIDDLSFAPVENTQLAVEIFFLMSGTLVTYSFLRYRLRAKTFNLWHFYLLRYIRLTPPVALLVLLYASVVIRAMDGPLWIRHMGFLRDYCQKWWWTNLLYINNYVNPYELCVSQSWYLSADFQLYLVSPLVLIPLHRRPRVGLALTGALLVLTTAGGFINAYVLELKSGGAVTFDRRTEVNEVEDYLVTHIRAASFLMGVGLGYFLFKIKQGQLIIKLSVKTQLLGWLVSISFILFSIFFVIYFQDPDYVYTAWLDTTYLVMHRHLMSLGIIWIILACTLGYGGFVDKFLSWSVFVPLARLTYCAFLTHVLMQNLQNQSNRTAQHISLANLHYHAIADFFVSFLSAVVLYLAVEAPVANITNVFFLGKRKSSEEETQTATATQLPVFKYTESSQQSQQ